MPGDKKKVVEAGATGYIEKSIVPDTFVSQMNSFLPPDFFDLEKL